MLNLLSEPLLLAAYALSLVVAITVHEFMHAFWADRLGDPTPRVQGRLTLNPLKHLDPLGTIALIFVGFGWGKPVSFDPYNLANPRRDAAIISVAGPASNMVMAILGSLILHALILQGIYDNTVFTSFQSFIAVNVVLAIFNLIPIHPLDGGKILIGLLPHETANTWDRVLQQYGMFLLLLLVLPIFGHSSLATVLIGPTISFILNILLPS